MLSADINLVASVVTGSTPVTVSIASGDTTPSRDDYTDYGYYGVTTGAITRTYTIQNLGDAQLNIGDVTISGAATADFQITTDPAATVSVAGSTTFTVSFDPSAVGPRNATVTITSDDPDESVYTFDITGAGLTTTNLGSGLHSGQLVAGAGDSSNTGETIVVNYTGYLLDGAKFDSSLNAGRQPFSFKLGDNTVIQGWELGMLNLQFNEQRLLIIPAVLAYGSAGSPPSIPADATLIFEVERLAPDVRVLGNTIDITHNDTTPALADHTSFDQVAVGQTLTRTYTVQNIGSDSLQLLGTPQVQLGGTNADQFSITPLAIANNTATFTVTYQPTVTGGHTATITIPTNDPDEANFTFTLGGSTWFSLSDTALSLPGTTSDDTLVVDASSGSITVTYNGNSQTFTTAQVSSILAILSTGNDTATITGTSTADTAKLYANGSVAFFDNGYTLTVTGTESITVNGAANDRAELYDSTGNDTFIAFPTWSRLSGTGFSNTVSGFGNIFVFGDNDGSDDFAEIYDTDGDDHVRHFSDFTDISSANASIVRYVKVENFDRVNVYGTSGSATSGGDFAEWWDSTGLDAFDAFADFAVMTRVSGGDGAGSRYVSNFDRYNAYAINGGGNNVAKIYDTNGNDQFRSFGAFSDMSTTSGTRSGLYRYVSGFERVQSTASNGGTNFAELYDTDGDDRFASFQSHSTITAANGTYAGNNRLATGYGQVNSYAVNGGTDDFAELYDSAGDDRLRSFEPFVDIVTGGLYRYVSGYERVNSYAINGGNDFAEFYDTSGNDAFRGMPTFSDMTSSVGLYRYASNYEQVNSYRTSGSGTDTATLFDSAGNDHFTGRTNFGQLVGSGYLLYASGYNTLTIDGSNGGTNTKDAQGISYTLTEIGVWT